MKVTKLRKIKFKLASTIAQSIYILREYHLVRLNDWLDFIAAKNNTEEIEN